MQMHASTKGVHLQCAAGTRFMHLQRCRHKGRALPAQRACTCSVAGTKVVHLQRCQHKVVHLQRCQHKGRAPAALPAQRSCTCSASKTFLYCTSTKALFTRGFQLVSGCSIGMNPDSTHLERWIRIWIEKYATGSELKSSREWG